MADGDLSLAVTLPGHISAELDDAIVLLADGAAVLHPDEQLAITDDGVLLALVPYEVFLEEARVRLTTSARTHVALDDKPAALVACSDRERITTALDHAATTTVRLSDRALRVALSTDQEV
jgi:hypothetical protein